MQLLSIVEGFAGAPSGTAEVYLAGQSTLAVVYADSDGVATLTNPVVLDANGGAVAYAAAAVDIIIKSSAGATVRSRFRQQTRAELVEIKSPSFTGVDPVTGTTAVSQPIDADTVMDRWITSAGAPDWKVRRSGASADETIVNAFSALSSQLTTLLYNVRTYGALGDGATDDAAAFDLAVNAAIAAGGGIVFVPGTATNYTLSRTITIASAKVSILGVGALASVVRATSALPCFAWVGGVTTAALNFCQGIGFTGSSALNTSSVTVASCPGFQIIACRGSVTAPTSATNGVFSVTCRVNIIGCTFANPAAAVHCAYFSTASLGSLMRDCFLEASSGIQFLTRQADQLLIDNCGHVSGATSTILIQCSGSPGSARIKVSNCHALTGKWLFNNGSNGPIVEFNNTHADAVSTTGAVTGGIGNNMVGTTGANTSRYGSKQLASGNVAAGATYTPRPDIIVHDLTILVALAVAAPVAAALNDGDRMIFIIFNNTAGALNVTWNAAYNVSVSPTAVAAAQRCRIEFVYSNTVWRAMNVAQVFA